MVMVVYVNFLFECERDDEGGEPKEFILVGKVLGVSVGVFCVLVMNDLGEFKFDGCVMF